MTTDNQDQNQTQPEQVDAAGAAQKQQTQTPPAPSVYKEIMTKKGFKSEEDFAKSYSEAEVSLSKTQNTLDQTKKSLEALGMTLNERGEVTPLGGGQYGGQQNYQQGYQQQGYQQQGYQQQGYQPEPVVDPYTGQVLTNPVDIQLASLPPSSRIGIVANAIVETREKWGRDSYTAETETLSSPGAKGFEKDVKNVMMSLPLEKRAHKQNWEDALLRVKGMRYEESMRNKGEQAVGEYINKESVQGLPGSGAGSAGAGGVKLDSAEETGFKWYEQNRPGMFKDRAHYARRMRSNTGG